MNSRINNNENKKKYFIIVGIIFIIVGIGFLIRDINVQKNYTKVTSELTLEIYRNGKKKAYVTYSFDGEYYPKKGLDSYNSFTMHNGGDYTIYIDPNKPEKPHTISYGFDLMFALVGAFSIFAVTKSDIKKRNEVE